MRSVLSFVKASKRDRCEVPQVEIWYTRLVNLENGKYCGLPSFVPTTARPSGSLDGK